jgi:hypothetical protein
MKKVTFFCLVFIGMIVSTINANTLNDNKVLAKEAQEKAFIKSVEFIEIEYELEANTELLKYLPSDFDPYKGMIMDISEIEFQKVGEPLHLGFNTADYLPKDFNPYRGQ